MMTRRKGEIMDESDKVHTYDVYRYLKLDLVQDGEPPPLLAHPEECLFRNGLLREGRRQHPAVLL